MMYTCRFLFSIRSQVFRPGPGRHRPFHPKLYSKAEFQRQNFEILEVWFLLFSKVLYTLIR
jgi:hypothetical protein